MKVTKVGPDAKCGGKMKGRFLPPPKIARNNSVV